MAHALVLGLRSLALCRALLGIGEGGFYPAAMRGAAQWFPPESRAKAVGLILSALCVGSFLTPPLVAWITLHYGWRASFLVIGALGLLLLPPWLLLHRRIDRARGEATLVRFPAVRKRTTKRVTLTRFPSLSCLASLALSPLGERVLSFYIFC